MIWLSTCTLAYWIWQMVNIDSVRQFQWLSNLNNAKAAWNYRKLLEKFKFKSAASVLYVRAQKRHLSNIYTSIRESRTSANRRFEATTFQTTGRNLGESSVKLKLWITQTPKECHQTNSETHWSMQLEFPFSAFFSHIDYVYASIALIELLICSGFSKKTVLRTRRFISTH